MRLNVLGFGSFGIHAGGAWVGVAQCVLGKGQVASVTQEAGCKVMAERVRGQVETFQNTASLARRPIIRSIDSVLRGSRR